MKLGMIMPCEVSSFDRAKDLGLDFVEFDLNSPLYWGPKMSDILAYKEDIKAASEKTGIEVGAIGRWGSRIIDENGEVIEEEWNEVKLAIEYAAYLGTKNFLCSVAYVNTLTYYKNLTAAIKVLNMIVEYAKQYDITVSIVNCMMGGNYIRTPEQWKIVLDEVPGLKIKYDPSHSFVHGGQNGAYLEEGFDWGDRFGYIHIKGVIQYGDSHEPQTWKEFELVRKYPELDGKICENGFNSRRYDNPPAGLDQINWKAFFAILYKYDYNGYLSIEPHSPSWHDERGENGIKYTIKYMRELMNL